MVCKLVASMNVAETYDLLDVEQQSINLLTIEYTTYSEQFQHLREKSLIIGNSRYIEHF